MRRWEWFSSAHAPFWSHHMQRSEPLSLQKWMAKGCSLQKSDGIPSTERAQRCLVHWEGDIETNQQIRKGNKIRGGHSNTKGWMPWEGAEQPPKSQKTRHILQREEARDHEEAIWAKKSSRCSKTKAFLFSFVAAVAELRRERGNLMHGFDL